MSTAQQTVMPLEETAKLISEWESWEREVALSHSIPELKSVGFGKADLLASALHHLEAGRTTCSCGEPSWALANLEGYTFSAGDFRIGGIPAPHCPWCGGKLPLTSPL